MALLRTFELPLRADCPPTDFGWDGREFSTVSETIAFERGIDQRDVFLGSACCVICGAGRPILERCHIIPVEESHTWSDLKSRRWLPEQAKKHPEHEPRAGLLMCLNHHILFNNLEFFIRFLPSKRKYILVNFSDSFNFQKFHGRAIGLDISDHHAPFPSLFLIHEMRVRGFHPFQNPQVELPYSDTPWQDWLLSEGVIDGAKSLFNRAAPPEPRNRASYMPQQFQSGSDHADGPSSGGNVLTLDANSINEILKATWESASWKACQLEGTSWDGTAEENIQKYKSIVGAEETSDSRPGSD